MLYEVKCENMQKNKKLKFETINPQWALKDRH